MNALPARPAALDDLSEDAMVVYDLFKEQRDWDLPKQKVADLAGFVAQVGLKLGPSAKKRKADYGDLLKSLVAHCNELIAGGLAINCKRARSSGEDT
jgi:hypothetical protein